MAMCWRPWQVSEASSANLSTLMMISSVSSDPGSPTREMVRKLTPNKVELCKERKRRVFRYPTYYYHFNNTYPHIYHLPPLLRLSATPNGSYARKLSPNPLSLRYVSALTPSSCLSLPLPNTSSLQGSMALAAIGPPLPAASTLDHG